MRWVIYPKWLPSAPVAHKQELTYQHAHTGEQEQGAQSPYSAQILFVPAVPIPLLG